MQYSPKKILYIITGLSTGGAETMLYKLLLRMDKEFYANQAISSLYWAKIPWLRR